MKHSLVGSPGSVRCRLGNLNLYYVCMCVCISSITALSLSLSGCYGLAPSGGRAEEAAGKEVCSRPGTAGETGCEAWNAAAKQNRVGRHDEWSLL